MTDEEALAAAVELARARLNDVLSSGRRPSALVELRRRSALSQAEQRYNEFVNRPQEEMR